MHFVEGKNFRDFGENQSHDKTLNEWQVSLLNEVNSNSEAQCQLRQWLNNTLKEITEESVCAAVWDGVFCWPPTQPGLVVQEKCSDIFKAIYPEYASHLEGHATRECLKNGSWAQGNESNYDECARSFEYHLSVIEDEDTFVPVAHYILFFGSILSLLCLGTSLFIFYHFRCLQCDRVTVHVHLMMSLVARFLLMFIITEPYLISHNKTFRDVEILCESILVLFLYSTFASVSWMFIQGLFLNVTLMIRVVSVSSRYQLTIYYIIGWGVPAVFVGVYVIAMLSKDQENCWKGYSKMDEMWILLGPITLELVANGIFLMNILRVLMKKVRTSTSRPDASQIKAAAKATAILFPVLGINNLILLHNPGGDYNKYFVALNTFFGSTQGIFVSIVYCFADKEVCAAFRRSVQRMNSRRFGNSNRTHNILRLPANFSRRQNSQLGNCSEDAV